MRPPTRDLAAALAPLTHLTDTESARVLGCAPSSVARVRRAHPELAGPKGRPGPTPTRAPKKASKAKTPRPRHLTVRASEAELAQLEGLASDWQTTATDAVWRAVAQALGERSVMHSTPETAEVPRGSIFVPASVFVPSWLRLQR